MKSTKLWSLLSAMDEQELRRLADFVASPYFNKRREVERLLNALLPLEKEAPTKEHVFNRVFPNKAFNDHRLRQSVSFLYKLALQFLGIEALQKEGQLVSQYGAKALRHKGRSVQGLKLLNETQDNLHASAHKNADFQEQAYQFLLEKHRLEFEVVRPGAGALQELSDQLDTAFLARKLWQACSLWSHESVSNAAYDYGLLPQVLDYLNQKGVPDEPAVSVYYHCYLALSRPDSQDYFRSFLTLLQENEHFFPDDELRDLYVLALNFCIRQNNAGNTGYRKEQFELYKKGIENQYFTSEGYLPNYTYLNAVTTALVVKELDWAWRFTNEHRHELIPSYQYSLWQFNRARLAYAQGDHGLALQCLRDVDFKDVLLQLAAKTLQVKVYYRMDAFDLLESHLQALHMFLRRKKDLGYHRSNYLNFIRLLRQRIEIAPFDTEALPAWRARVEQTAELAEREWLVEI